ncbi:recombinase family protein [Romboutsia lituseburensis]|uniref:recombinase family protein n=1 Tax=Romboutsia lituseburensis TaxID=1537 RepID=UPI00215A3548|nr:recombinase family protein [Romboutsia lituseburensis]MCR8744383.1 recombinase family protein [Romboutsia lituseburensis]
MNTVIYLRKSREDRDLENASIEDTLRKHKSTLLKIAKEKKLNIVEIKEEVVSGESIANRPKMLELLDEVKNGLYDAVLVMDIDRLGRGNMQDQGLILETFKNSNTKIITPRKLYDLNNEFDEEYSEFEAFMARKELKIISRRLQRGKIKSIEDGKYIAQSAPYGYKIEYINNHKDRVLVIDEEKADVIKTIFDMYNKNIGALKICNHLNALGLKTTTGRTWYEKAIRDIIKNKTYCGYVVWNRVERKKGSSRTRSADEQIEALGKHEPIISEELWNKCQNIRKNRSISPTSNNVLTNSLAGLVKCSICGYTLTTNNATIKHKDGSNTYKTYLVCKNCRNRGTKLSIIEDRILDSLKDWLHNYKVSLSNKEVEYKSNDLDNYNKIVINLRNELSELDKQKNNLHDLLERGIYDVDTFIERSNNLKDRIDSISNTLNSTLEIIDYEKKKNIATTNIIPNLEYVIDQYYSIDDITIKNNLLKSVIDKVIYTKDHKRRDEHDFNIVIYPKLPK